MPDRADLIAATLLVLPTVPVLPLLVVVAGWVVAGLLLSDDRVVTVAPAAAALLAEEAAGVAVTGTVVVDVDTEVPVAVGCSDDADLYEQKTYNGRFLDQELNKFLI